MLGQEFSEMKKLWHGVRGNLTNAYSKQPTQNVHCKEGFDGSPNTLQWFPMNPNKQDASRSIGYGEMPNYEREQVLNWYQTVPLRHDSFPEDVNPKETVQEQMNRKVVGKTLNEREKRYRTSFTTFQLGRLEEEFQKDMYAVGMKRMRLAGELNLSEKQVKIWFQNRRMKYKRVCQRIHNRRLAVNRYWE